jgi:hypothetical protein
MSSPFDPETKSGTEETLQAISRATRWLSRIDTGNDLSKTTIDVDVNSVVSELCDAEDQLRERYRIRRTEMSVDNFVYNNIESVTDILCGDLDETVEALSELQSYIKSDFGSVRPLALSKEELLWLVAQEVKYHQDGTVHGMDEYNTDPFSSVDLESCGECPDEWVDNYPLYNRDL